ncbi:Flp family type IVb pilin [Photobacterium sanguinicancri]|uniref:Flp family type IVb pilin n=1 Tax=Photobacterium sanguinicancri TaxID=875932 RepID=A0ABX4FRZ2_9GAMM|nr:Flp family type IVb pilin [Photobacterium sanguinicancri]OZS41400.1 Flp family type IVb pilin [Photobacterium sanguinicancri]
MKNLLSQFWNNEDGVTAIEYALIGVAMAGVLSFVLTSTAGGSGTSFLDRIKQAFATISTKMNTIGSQSHS